MSQRNTQSAKTAARERMRAERERQVKKEKTKRQIIVGGSVVVVLAIAAGVGWAVTQNNGSSGSSDHWASAADQKLVKPANTSGKDGTTVVIGKESAEKTLQMYEDPRCPVCAQFEQAVGPTIDKAVEDGTYKIQYIGATFLDDNLKGEGSKNALSAQGAALNVSADAFLQYKKAMYAKENHPDETTDGFKSDATLIKIANQVPALKDNKAFQKDVKKGTYDKWALTMSKKFDDSKGVNGTPTLMMDGKKLTSPGSDNAPGSVEEFNNALDPILKG
ncbi:thioredoxin domain-containing protein [Streptomyces tsukubensis]|uniref:Disulfide bond formation protein DsbA n=1 Tax=Streptomyces tsukubensis TaxID=83656 RepID=A0A1V4A7C2_9ACTN|nr:thioredoxin domain-containing protein [Streptomyces tsukubensis]OON77613.1 disulfide bond formation protein DsbA [Streptomyces tsukubensis]QFR93116.1 thioredoxin domain-containing protein [Streptomyces tsukubensis]